MTGFARRTGVAGAVRWSWEVRTVNGRGLELRFRLPPGFDALESGFRGKLASRISRGTVQATLTAQRESSEPRIRVNEARLSELINIARRIEAGFGIAMPTLDGMLSVPGILDLASEDVAEPLTPELVSAFDAGLSEVLEELVLARRREGEAIKSALEHRLDEVEKLTRAASRLAALHPEAMRERIVRQVALLMGSVSELDPQRLHQEALLLATRADIGEELDRLLAHVDAARELLAAGSPAGRQLDFLVQEFSREANTLCAKAGDLALTKVGLELKAVIDRLREQVQNLE